MGGFRLQGPNYRFVSIPTVQRCRCMGYSGTIDADVETLLLNNRDKYLELSALPRELREEMQKHHLGDNMSYDVIPASMYTRNISEERDALLKDIHYIVTNNWGMSSSNGGIGGNGDDGDEGDMWSKYGM